MKYQLFDPLPPDDFAALKADIRERGVLVPVEMDEHGDILDGHHRVQAWQELRTEGVNLADYPRMIRPGMSEEQKRNHVRALNLLRRHLPKEARAQVFADMRRDGMSLRAIAEATGVSHVTVKNAIEAGVNNLTPRVVIGRDGKSYPAQRPVGAILRAHVGSFDPNEEFGPEWEPRPPRREIDEDTGEYLDSFRPSVSKPHVTHNSGQNEWYTPTEIIEAARRVMGRITLDPASSVIANSIVQADYFYTIQDDGLAQDWTGCVWLNPPYSQPEIGRFADKVHQEIPRLDQLCILVNNATETAWFQRMLEVASSVCLLRSRVKFLDMQLKATGAPLQGQVLIYVGANTDAFYAEFSALGAILEPR